MISRNALHINRVEKHVNHASLRKQVIKRKMNKNVKSNRLKRRNYKTNKSTFQGFYESGPSKGSEDGRADCGSYNRCGRREIVSWQEELWISTTNGNIWEPDIYGWTIHVEQKQIKVNIVITTKNKNILEGKGQETTRFL